MSDIERLLSDPTLILDGGLTFLNVIPSLTKSLITERCPLDEVYIDGLDGTQVWGQVEMVLDSCGLSSELGEYADTQQAGFSGDEQEEDEEIQDSEADQDEEEEDEDDDDDDEEEEENVNDGEDQDEDDDEGEDQDEDYDVKPQIDAFGLNDQFFDIDQYQKQVLALEDENADTINNDSEEIDMFADLDDDSDDEMYNYDDYFKPQVDAPMKKKVSFGKKNQVQEFHENEFDDAYEEAMADMLASEAEDEDVPPEMEDEVDPENLSTFEKQQRALAKEIAALEAESIAEKKWTLKGEVSAKQRDSDSILAEELEFDRTAKPAPVITQDVTESLEEIIKNRIINSQFDDIPRRLVSETDPSNFKTKVSVDETKSKKSLAELYEDEAQGRDAKEEKISEELQNAHDEITRLFDKVNWKLDSLYSAHFIPKPQQKLIDVRVQTSTVTMEDAQPLTMGSADRLAPQEIYKSGSKISKDEVMLRSGVVMSKNELSRDDKKRLRRAKKRKTHQESKEQALKKKKVQVSQL